MTGQVERSEWEAVIDRFVADTEHRLTVLEARLAELEARLVALDARTLGDGGQYDRGVGALQDAVDRVGERLNAHLADYRRARG
jgi:hypothetical protein